MDKFFSYIIRHRVAVLIITLVALAAAGWQFSQTELNSDVASYLPDSSISKQTITMLSEEFSIHGDAIVCLEGSEKDFPEIKKLADELISHEEIDEVLWLGTYEQLFAFDKGEIVSSESMIPNENVKELTNGLYIEHEGKNYYFMNIAIKAQNASEEAGEALKLIEDTISDYHGDYYIGGNAVQSNNMLESALGELPMFLTIAVVIIAIILLVTSPSIMSAVIFLVTIGISIIFNLGTNIFTPNISTVTFSVAAVLQLALSMDYSIFLTHSYNMARKSEDDISAMITAIKKTLVVIAASALTTVAGFCALFAMKYELGFDLGLCLAKGVTFSFLTVVFVQPCLLILFRKACDKTKHRALSPSFERLSNLPRKLKIAAPIIGIVLLVPAFLLSNKMDYYYLESQFDTNASGPQAVVQNAGNQSIFVCETVSGEKQLELSRKIKEIPGVTEVNGYYALLDTIAHGIKVPVYSSLTEQNSDTVLFTIELSDKDILAIADGKQPDIDIEKLMSEAIKEQVQKIAPARIQQSIYNLSAETGAPVAPADQQKLAAAISEQVAAELQAVVAQQLVEFGNLFDGFGGQFDSYKEKFFTDIDGVQHTFFTAKIAGQPEGKEAIQTVEKINETVTQVLGTSKSYAAGNTQTVADLASTTAKDFVVVSVLSGILILIILFVTFRSFITPVLLVLLIELAIFINLAISVIMGTSLNFMSYVVISAIQLGATIDYAILMTKNYRTELDYGDHFYAIKQAVKQSSFPILTSMSILCCACLSVYFVSSDTIIREITMLIARGAFISGLLVILLLPAILTFTSRKVRPKKQ